MLDIVDPTSVGRRLADVPTLQDALIKVADTVPAAGDIVGPAGFLDRLVWYRGMLADTLAEGVPTWEPQRHLYGLVKDFIDRSGKGLRPALCIATARALGGRAEDAFPAAAGLEMLHNAFLVHDDIEDGSDWRRGVATMHRRAGMPIAVNTGDAMNALAMRLFRKTGERLGPVVALRIFDEVDHMVVETLEGQAMELGWVRDNDLTVGGGRLLPARAEEDRLVQLHSPDADRRARRQRRRSEPRPLQPFRLPARAGVPDHRRRAEPRGATLRDTGRRSAAISGRENGRFCSRMRSAGRSRTDRAWMSGFLARPRERRLPREVLRLHDIIASSGGIEWA